MPKTKMTDREKRKRNRPGQASRRDVDVRVPSPGQAARARSAELALPATARKVRPGYTEPGTAHEPTVRKGQGGRRARRGTPSPGWLVAPGPPVSDVLSPANDRAAALPGAGLHRSDITTPYWQVPSPVPGQARRRVRRPGLRAEAKQSRRAVPLGVNEPNPDVQIVPCRGLRSAARAIRRAMRPRS
jgi:hypothetical protein